MENAEIQNLLLKAWLPVFKNVQWFGSTIQTMGILCGVYNATPETILNHLIANSTKPMTRKNQMDVVYDMFYTCSATVYLGPDECYSRIKFTEVAPLDALAQVEKIWGRNPYMKEGMEKARNQALRDAETKLAETKFVETKAVSPVKKGFVFETCKLCGTGENDAFCPDGSRMCEYCAHKHFEYEYVLIPRHKVTVSKEEAQIVEAKRLQEERRAAEEKQKHDEQVALQRIQQETREEEERRRQDELRRQEEWHHYNETHSALPRKQVSDYQRSKEGQKIMQTWIVMIGDLRYHNGGKGLKSVAQSLKLVDSSPSNILFHLTNRTQNRLVAENQFDIIANEIYRVAGAMEIFPTQEKCMQILKEMGFDLRTSEHIVTEAFKNIHI